MNSNNPNTFIISILIALFMSSCATRLDTVSPAGTDLSGTWLLDKSASQIITLSPERQTQQSGGMGGMGGMGGGMGGNQQGSESPADSAGGERNNAQRGLTPAMKTLEMTIEQNHDSMGIAYPDEIYRDVDWGEKEFYRETVTAGWQDNSLIIISASDQMTLTETYQLNPAQDVLSLSISIKDQRSTNEFIRVFNLQK